MTLRRLLSIPLIVSLLSASIPAQPAGAVSTASEIQMGQQEDKAVLQQYTVLKDPLLNAWANEIGNKLWDQTARKDVPYNLKIVDDDSVNAFSTLGGYVYMNSGTLDFVQSDDELASVIGHETGHIERRHGVTFPAKAQILDLLFGIASIFSPFIYRFGQLAEAGIMAKASRAQEIQADQYGLLLMSRAGYDPDAMVTFMKHLGAAEDSHDSLVDKYFADHPGVPDRVAHLVGYAELNPKTRTQDQLLVQALHDQQTARYSIAATKLQDVLKAEPDNATALLHLGETQLALGLPNKSEQTLAAAAAASKGAPATHTAAVSAIKNLRENQAQFNLVHPNLAPLRTQLSDAVNREAQAVSAIALRRDPARDQLKAVNARLQNISYEVPDLSNIQVRPGGRTDTLLKNLSAMARSIHIAFGKSSEIVSGIGSLEKNKESGLVKENADIFTELQAPLKLDVVPPASLAILPSYPAMLSDLELADGDLIRSIDASRSALALLDVSLGDLDEFIRRLAQSRLDFNGDINSADYASLNPLMTKANDSLNNAALAGAQAWQLFNLARSRQLQTRITMLGLGFPEDRYATLRYALQQRVKNTGLDYDAMVHQNLTPGEIAAAAIIAADTNSTPQAVVDEAKNTNRRVIDVANARNMSALALEIFLGLVYLDYTDDPQKEIHPLGGGATASMGFR